MKQPKGVKEASDIVTQANEKLIAQGRLRAENLDKQTQKTLEFAAAMEKAGGIDAETLAVGMAGLQKYLDPAQIEAMSKGWQDWMVTINKGAPTWEQARENVAMINEYIKRGRPAALSALGLTKEQIDAIGELNTVQERAAVVIKVLGKETGETARWKKTDAGVTYDMNQAAEANLEIIGGPMVAAQREWNLALTELYKALGPMAELIAKQMSPAVQELSTFLRENKDNIAAWGETAVNWTTWVVESFAWLQQQSENFFKPIAENTLREIENVQKGFQAAWDGIKAIWDTVAGYFDGVAANIAKAFEPLYDWIVKPFQDAWNQVQKIFPGLGGAAGGAPVAAPAPYSGGARAPEDYIPPWQQTGPPTAPVAQGGAVPTPTVMPGAGNIPMPYTPGAGAAAAEAATTTGAAFGALKDVRARFAEEFAKDPQLRQRFMASVKAETGDQPAATQQAYMESIMNRAAAENKSLRAIIENPNYYPAATKSKLGRTFSPEEQARLEGMTGQVLGGSNVAKFATGNESLNVGYKTRAQGKWMPILSQPKGGYERFVGETHTRKWVEGMQAAERAQATAPLSATGAPIVGASMGETAQAITNARTQTSVGPTNVSNAPVININAPGGDAQAIGREVSKASNNSSSELLTQLRAARNQEARLGYV